MSLDSGSFEEGLALAMLGRAVHASGTRALDGMAELTFYDTLVAVAAAEGARRRAAWIIDREVKPPSWTGDERIDLVVLRKSAQNFIWVSATELKWWRSSDSSNSSNRRRDLLVDFLRAASVDGFIGVEEKAYVVLISTEAAWRATTNVSRGNDQAVCDNLKATGVAKWSLRELAVAPSMKNAVNQLRRSIQVPSTFHSTLLKHFQAPIGGGNAIEVRVWAVRKPQRSTELDAAQLEQFFGPDPKGNRAGTLQPAVAVPTVRGLLPSGST